MGSEFLAQATDDRIAYFIAIGAVFGFAAIVLIYLVSVNNRFAALYNHLRESWSDVDVQLKRRHDLIPNLVETVKGLANFEKSLLTQVTEARGRAVAGGAAGPERLQAENALAGAANLLLMRYQEAYPDLKAPGAFQGLMSQLSETEDRIAAARRFYNANVRDYNTLLESFPAGMIGRSGGRPRAEFFECTSIEAALPKLDALTQ